MAPPSGYHKANREKVSLPQFLMFSVLSVLSVFSVAKNHSPTPEENNNFVWPIQDLTSIHRISSSIAQLPVIK